MGEELTRKPERSPEPNQRGANPGTAPGTGNRPEPAPGNPGAGNSTARNPGTPAPGNPAGTPAGKAEEKVAPGLASVIDAPPAPEPPKKKQTRKRTPKPKAPDGFSSDQITALLVSVSAIAAARPGMEIWALSEVEAKQIADPLANMIAKSEKLQKAGEYADAVALVTACLVVFLPRTMIYFDQQKQKKIEQNGGAVLVRKESKGNGGTGKPSGPNAPDTKANVNSIFASIPPSI